MSTVARLDDGKGPREYYLKAKPQLTIPPAADDTRVIKSGAPRESVPGDKPVNVKLYSIVVDNREIRINQTDIQKCADTEEHPERLAQALAERGVSATATRKDSRAVHFRPASGRDARVTVSHDMHRSPSEVSSTSPLSTILGALVDLGLDREAADSIARQENTQVVMPQKGMALAKTGN